MRTPIPMTDHRTGPASRLTPARLRLLLLPALAFVGLLAGCGEGAPSDGPAADEAPAGNPPAAATPGATTTGTPVAPSFDCTAASGEIEALICATPELARLDLRLDSVWRQVEGQLASGSWPESEQNVVRAEQRGWIAGRNECWQAEDPRTCAVDEYVRRIVGLEAGFGLVPPGDPTFWSCEGNPANEFVLTFVPTEPRSVRVERGDGQEIMIQTPAASGARYLGTFGKEVWVRGEEGTFVWPQTDTLTCRLREGG